MLMRRIETVRERVRGRRSATIKSEHLSSDWLKRLRGYFKESLQSKLLGDI
jgi:hypothetical protein